MIEEIEVWEYMHSKPVDGKRYTYSRATGVAKVKQGRKFVYVVPYGEGWECDNGHFVTVLTQEKFDKTYSLEYVGR